MGAFQLKDGFVIFDHKALKSPFHEGYKMYFLGRNVKLFFYFIHEMIDGTVNI